MIELKDLSQGSRIAYARKYRGLTQSDLGILCGFDPGGAGIRINQYERNHKHPRDDCLKKISEVLQVDICYLQQYDFTGKDDIFCFQLWMLIANDPNSEDTIRMIMNN